jgi:hypothetical protein
MGVAGGACLGRRPVDIHARRFLFTRQGYFERAVTFRACDRRIAGRRYLGNVLDVFEHHV